MKYKQQFAKSASAVVNGESWSLELLEWCKERLTNEHGMTAIWDAQITRDVIDLFGTNEEKIIMWSGIWYFRICRRFWRNMAESLT